MLGKAIYSILTGDATLTGLVETKIYPVQAPQRTSIPFVVYRENSTIPVNHQDGTAPIDGKLIQIDTYAATLTEAHTIGERIRTLLDNYSGTASDVVIRRMWFVDQDDGDYVEDLGFHGISQEYEASIQR